MTLRNENIASKLLNEINGIRELHCKWILKSSNMEITYKSLQQNWRTEAQSEFDFFFPDK